MNEGVWKSFGLASTSSVNGEENNFLFPSLKGGKLFIVTSALKSQRRVRCEFGDVCFLEIGCLQREIN